MNRSVLIMGFIVLMTAQIVSADGSTKARLDTCVSYYQDGEYQKAADSIKALLPLVSDRREEAEAYKYLGFSYVMLDLIDKAKEFFRVALEKFPQMVIDTLEVPPNITIVFRQAKLETQLEKGEINDKKLDEKQQRHNRVVFASILTATGVVSAAVAGYFFYEAHHEHSQYELPATQTEFDNHWSAMQRDVIIGGCATAFTAVDLFFGFRLFAKKPLNSPQKVGLIIEGNRVALAGEF
ncbi:MAG: tetratricopeptide repeat protein [Chitinispirillaceae bacterium]